MKEEKPAIKARIGAGPFQLNKMELRGVGDSQLLEIELEHSEKG